MKTNVLIIGDVHIKVNNIKERLNIFEECPSLEQRFKQIKKLTISFCGECGCPISKKIFSNKFNPCPLGKWKDVDESHPDFFKIRKNKML